LALAKTERVEDEIESVYVDEGELLGSTLGELGGWELGIVFLALVRQKYNTGFSNKNISLNASRFDVLTIQGEGRMERYLSSASRRWS
jgi:hypothetical protein